MTPPLGWKANLIEPHFKIKSKYLFLFKLREHLGIYIREKKYVKENSLKMLLVLRLIKGPLINDMKQIWTFSEILLPFSCAMYRFPWKNKKGNPQNICMTSFVNDLKYPRTMCLL